MRFRDFATKTKLLDLLKQERFRIHVQHWKLLRFWSHHQLGPFWLRSRIRRHPQSLRHLHLKVDYALWNIGILTVTQMYNSPLGSEQDLIG